MRKIPVFFLLIIFNTSFLLPRQLVFVTSEYPPYSSINLKKRGLLVQLIKESYNAAGVKRVKIVFEPWYRALESTRKGEYDGVFTLWYKEERKEHFAYSDPILKDRLTVFTNVDSNIAINNQNDFKKVRSGTVIGYGYPKWFTEMNLLKEENTYDEPNFYKLIHGRIDVVIAEEKVGEYYIKKLKFEKKIRSLRFTMQNINHYLGFSKRKNYKKNLYNFNKGLSIIKKNGRYHRIIQEQSLNYENKK